MAKKNKLVAPVLKWVGGKRQLLGSINQLIPKKITSYCEPFFGGGAVLFDLQPKRVIINDLNEELIDVYEVIRDNPDELIEELKKHKNEAEYFYEMRELDRNIERFSELSKIQRASRTIYLNKTCYNGLFRVNNSGEFNTPFGRYKNPSIINEPVLRAVNKYFNSSDIVFSHIDYSKVLENIPRGTFVYLDPPYDPISETSNFTGYNRMGFGKSEQERLKDNCDILHKRGIKFLLSNSCTNFTKELYSKYHISIIKAKRSINSNATKRGDIDEILVRNYE